MARHRIDFHVHTRVSPDGLDRPEAVVAAARRAGLSGVAITDHDRRGGYDRLVELGLADPRGRAVDGFLVIPGVEVSTTEGHVLVIGAAWDVPPSAGGVSAEVVARAARGVGALAVAAHPFDKMRSGVGTAVLGRVGFDAVESFNSKTIERRSNAQATAYSRRHALPLIAGSDSHQAQTVGRAHTIVEAGELSVDGVLAAVREGRTELHEGVHTWGEMAAYWARGWLTRPWLVDLTARSAARFVRRRTAQMPDLLPDLYLPAFDLGADESFVSTLALSYETRA